MFSLPHPRLRSVMALAILLGLAQLSTRAALAQPATAEQAVPAPAWGPRADLGLLLGLPATLGAGQTAGVAAGVATGGPLAFGLRASWSTATEYTLTWHVTHSEVRLRAHVTALRQLGRGAWLVRLAGGATALHESRIRDQSARLSESGTALTTSAWALLPGVDLEAGVNLRIAGEWGLAVTGGPSLHLVDGALSYGWTGTLGVAWLP